MRDPKKVCEWRTRLQRIGAKSGYISRFNTAKGERHLMNNSLLVAAFVAVIITPITKWLVPNYFGRNLIRFWDLKSEVCKALSVPEKSQMGRLANETDTLSQILPKPIGVYLCLRGYKLHSAALALTALSKSIGGDSHCETVNFRVQAQEALRLCINPPDLRLAQCYRRIENVIF
jgi:hypothetical protein